MPSRKRVDRAPILKLFSELGHVSRTAKALGLNELTVRQVVRNSNGMCMRCGARPHRKNMTKCAECAEWERIRTANRRARAKATGHCFVCNEPIYPGSRLYCKVHHKQTLDRQRLHRTGPNALARWAISGLQCEICGQKSDRGPGTKTHLHHIDGDDSNDAAENLICLCRTCHYISHRLLGSRNRIALIAWFERTYPDKPLR
jgi:hypothetical protein